MARRATESDRHSGRHSSLGLPERNSYAFFSTRPLHILVFLLPLVIFYELGSAFFLTRTSPLADPAIAGSDAARVIRAERLLSSFFEMFGVGGLYLPGILLVIILLIWHILTPDRWRIRISVPLWMTVESVIWTLPLLVLGQMVMRAFEEPAGLVVFANAGGYTAMAATDLQQLSKPARATIAIGAGLYEELLFRLVAIALVHTIAADLLKIKDAPAKVIAVFVSAVAFAFYHDVMIPGMTGVAAIDASRLAVFTLAGIYFGAVYVIRGFGIVVAVHAIYDLAVLVLLVR